MRSLNVTICSLLVIFLLLHISMSNADEVHDKFLKCLVDNSPSSPPISSSTFFPNNPQFTPTLQSLIRNQVFNTSKTPKPVLIVAPTHISHIQASVICCKTHGLEMRIRSGGHDYDGLSYVSNVPFILLDMFNLRSISINMADETAWVDSGATLGELFHAIGKASKIHGFPGGVCPTVGVGGHFTGAGYGNMLRKYGLTVDHVVDAKLVDVNGKVLDRKSMGEDLFWAIRCGGGASFGVIVSWKIKLVNVGEVVTVFKVERTLEQDALRTIWSWQRGAQNVGDNAFIRAILMPATRKGNQTINIKFVGLFVGPKKAFLKHLDHGFRLFRLNSTDAIEMSWIDSVLFWANYPQGSSTDILLNRQPKREKFVKKKSDYVQKELSLGVLESLMKKLMELKKPILTFNPYGGRMSDISESETPFPHRAGNLYKIQYSVQWDEEGDEALNQNSAAIREIYDFMTPHVSKLPRGAYLNYRDIDLGTNGVGNASYAKASVWGSKYFKGNFDRLVKVKTMVDPANFFKNEQSIPSSAAWKNYREL